RKAVAVVEIASDVQVRKQQAFLKDVADAPRLGFQEYALLGVHEHAPGNFDASAFGPCDARDGIDHAGLSRARAAEERRNRRIRLEGDVEIERAQALLDI